MEEYKMEAQAQQRQAPEVVGEGELNRRRQSLVGIVRNNPELDSIPNEELGSRIRVPNENVEEVREYVTKFLEHVGELYHEAEQRSGQDGGLSLSQFESMLRETHSEPEVALGSLAFVQYIRGEQLVQPQYQLEEAKRVLKEALDAPWTKRFGMAHEVDSVYRLLLKEMKRQAKEIEHLGKLEIASRDARILKEKELELEAQTETERYEIELEHQRQQFLLDTDRIREQYEIRKERLVDEKLAELKAQELLQQEKEQELLNQRQELLQQYKLKLFDRIVDLETKQRWNIMRKINRETRYTIGWEGIQHLVEAELKEGDNLEDFPAEPRRNKGEYKEQFLKRYFGNLLTRRLSNVELDKDRAMMEAFDILYESLTEDGELPDVEEVTIDDWHNALSKTEDGIEGLVTTYEIAELEDTTLQDEISGFLERNDKLRNYMKEADLIHAACSKFFGKNWNLNKPKIVDMATYQSYVKLAERQFEELTNTEGSDLEYHVGSILLFTDKKEPTSNVVPGLYIVGRNSNSVIYVKNTETDKSWTCMRAEGKGDSTNPRDMNIRYKNVSHIKLLNFRDFYLEMKNRYGIDSNVTLFRVTLEQYHPYFKQEFQARLLYDKAMKSRFERLLESEKKD